MTAAATSRRWFRGWRFVGAGVVALVIGLLSPRHGDAWREIAQAGHRVGPPGAKVVVTQFSDMTCGYCRELAATLQRIHDSLPNVVISYRHAILVADPETIAAAKAIVCADEQGRYWPMYQHLATHRLEKGSAPYFHRLGRLVGADERRFLECVSRPSTLSRLERDAEQARRLGIVGTPLVLVNSRVISGALPYDDLVALIRLTEGEAR